MAKRTKKVGICGKYIWNAARGLFEEAVIKKVEAQQHIKYICWFCGEKKLKCSCVGTWTCKGCKKDDCRSSVCPKYRSWDNSAKFNQTLKGNDRN